MRVMLFRIYLYPLCIIDVHPTFMATTREELPRVSVGTFQDWQRLESNYKAAAITRVEELIRDNGLAAADEDALLAHMNQVNASPNVLKSQCRRCSHSSLTEPLRWPSRTFA